MCLKYSPSLLFLRFISLERELNFLMDIFREITYVLCYKVAFWSHIYYYKKSYFDFPHGYVGNITYVFCYEAAFWSHVYCYKKLYLTFWLS